MLGSAEIICTKRASSGFDAGQVIFALAVPEYFSVTSRDHTHSEEGGARVSLRYENCVHSVGRTASETFSSKPGFNIKFGRGAGGGGGATGGGGGGEGDVSCGK